MSEKKPNPFGWFVHGPLGPWGRRLGFRWVFPIGTMPVPFHPLFFPLMMLGLVGWTGFAAYSALMGAAGANTNWATLLVLALLLGLVLSMPVIAWIFLALGGAIIQAVLILCAMVLLGIECWQGRAHPAWALLPGGYAGLFAVQTLLGRPWLRRLQRQQAAFGPQDTGQMPVALTQFDHQAKGLIETSAIPNLYCPLRRGLRKARHFHWLAPEDAEALAGEWGATPPPGWKLEPREGAMLLIREGAPQPRRAIRVHTGRYRAPFWLVTGLRTIEAKGGGRRWRLVYGDAHVTRPIPLATLFRFTSITGPSDNRWFAGFSRFKAATFPPPEADHAHQLTLLFPARDVAAPNFDREGLAALRAEIAEHSRKRAALRVRALANRDMFWKKLADGSALSGLDRATFDLLRDEPDLLTADRVETTLDWFERTRDARSMIDLISAARLLAAFSETDLAPHIARLETLFDSAKLALQWNIHEIPDRKTLPDKIPLFAGTYAGFGLFLACPSLYAKLARVSPRLAQVERNLGERLDRGEPGLRHQQTLVMSGRWGAALGKLDAS